MNGLPTTAVPNRRLLAPVPRTPPQARRAASAPLEGAGRNGHGTDQPGATGGANRPRPPSSLSVAERIERSITYMRAHLHEPLRVATLAGLAGFSPPYYFVLFKRETGRTPIDYFIRLRMDAARGLLANSASRVKEVAAALGYEDPLYFSRVFKAAHHVAPSHYRLRCGSEAPLTAPPDGAGKLEHQFSGPQPNQENGR